MWSVLGTRGLRQGRVYHSIKEADECLRALRRESALFSPTLEPVPHSVPSSPPINPHASLVSRHRGQSRSKPPKRPRSCSMPRVRRLQRAGVTGEPKSLTRQRKREEKGNVGRKRWIQIHTHTHANLLEAKNLLQVEQESPKMLPVAALGYQKAFDSHSCSLSSGLAANKTFLSFFGSWFRGGHDTFFLSLSPVSSQTPPFFPNLTFNALPFFLCIFSRHPAASVVTQQDKCLHSPAERTAGTQRLEPTYRVFFKKNTYKKRTQFLDSCY